MESVRALVLSNEPSDVRRLVEELHRARLSCDAASVDRGSLAIGLNGRVDLVVAREGIEALCALEEVIAREQAPAFVVLSSGRDEIQAARYMALGATAYLGEDELPRLPAIIGDRIGQRSSGRATAADPSPPPIDADSQPSTHGPALAAIARLLRPHRLEEVRSTLLAEIGRALGADRVELLHRDPAAQTLHLVERYPPAPTGAATVPVRRGAPSSASLSDLLPVAPGESSLACPIDAPSVSSILHVVRASAFSAAEQDMLEGVAAMMETALRRDGAGSADAHDHRQSALVQVSQFALAESDPVAVMDEVLHQACATLTMDRGEVWELLPGEEWLRLRAGIGLREAGTDEPPLVVGSDSLVGATQKSGEPMVLGDLQRAAQASDPRLVELGVRSALTVPLRGRSGSLGVLAFYAVDPRSFSVDDRYFVQVLGNILAAARERLHEQEKRQVLLDLARTAAAQLERDEILERLESLLARALGCAGSLVFWRDSGNHPMRLRRRAGTGDGVPVDATLAAALGSTMARRLERATAAIHINADRHQHLLSEIDSHLNAAALLAAPLRVGERTLGVLVATAAGRPAFDKRQAELFEGIAQNGAVALQAAELRDREQHEAQAARSLVRISRELMAGLERPDLYHHACELARELFSAGRAALLLRADAREPLRIECAGEATEGFRSRLAAADADTLLDRAALDGVVHIDAGESEAAEDGLELLLDGASRGTCLALNTGSESFGLLIITWTERPPFEISDHLAHSFAQLLSIAVAHTHQMRELDRQLRREIEEQAAEIADWRSSAGSDRKTPQQSAPGPASSSRDGGESGPESPPAASPPPSFATEPTPEPTSTPTTIPEPEPGTTPEPGILIADKGAVAREAARRLEELAVRVRIRSSLDLPEDLSNAATPSLSAVNLASRDTWTAIRSLAMASLVPQRMVAYAHTAPFPAGLWFGNILPTTTEAFAQGSIAQDLHRQLRIRRAIAIGNNIETLNDVRNHLAQEHVSSTTVLNAKQALQLTPTVNPEAAIFILSGSVLALFRTMVDLRKLARARDIPFVLVFDDAENPGGDAVFSANVRTMAARGNLSTEKIAEYLVHAARP